jgi:hypothetical protein
MPKGQSANRFAARTVVCAAFALVVMLSASPSAPASEPEVSAPLGLGYRLYAGGLHALTFDAAVDMNGAGYNVEFEARTDGWIGRLFAMVLTATAVGNRTEQGLRPQVFRTANTWQGNDERWVELTYGASGAPLTEAEPPPGEDDRNKVPENLRHGTVDPITAVFDLLGADGNEACTGRAAVFDGRRRYDLEAERIGPANLRSSGYSIYSGPATECRLVFREIEGFWKKKRMQGRYPSEIRVWLADVGNARMAVPVRMSAKTRFAAVRVHLTRLNLPSGTTLALEE